MGAAISGRLTAKGNRLQFTGTVRPHVTFDGGTTWTTYAVDFNGYADTIDPTLAFDASGTVYLAVAASGTANSPDIVVTRSGDGGRTWSSAVRVASGAGSSGSAVYHDHPRLGASGNGDVVVTGIHSDFGSQGTFGDAPVFDAVSHDGGQSWSTPTAIFGSAPFCTGPQGDNACDLTFR